MAKTPRFKGPPPRAGKTPRIEPKPPVVDDGPVWRIARLDSAGSWCAHNMEEAHLREIVAKLQGFELNTWLEIARGGSHNVGVSRLIPAAQKRLQELKLDDLDDLYSLRINAKTRLWGMKTNNVFSALWWDCDHAVCPSLKKHT